MVPITQAPDAELACAVLWGCGTCNSQEALRASLSHDRDGSIHGITRADWFRRNPTVCPVGAARVQTRSPVSRVDLMETAIIMAYWPNDPTDAGERHCSSDNGQQGVAGRLHFSCAHGAHGPRQYPRARFSAGTCRGTRHSVCMTYPSS